LWAACILFFSPFLQNIIALDSRNVQSQAPAFTTPDPNRDPYGMHTSPHSTLPDFASNPDPDPYSMRANPHSTLPDFASNPDPDPYSMRANPHSTLPDFAAESDLDPYSLHANPHSSLPIFTSEADPDPYSMHSNPHSSLPDFSLAAETDPYGMHANAFSFVPEFAQEEDFVPYSTQTTTFPSYNMPAQTEISDGPPIVAQAESDPYKRSLTNALGTVADTFAEDFYGNVQVTPVRPSSMLMAALASTSDTDDMPLNNPLCVDVDVLLEADDAPWWLYPPLSRAASEAFLLAAAREGLVLLRPAPVPSASLQPDSRLRVAVWVGGGVAHYQVDLSASPLLEAGQPSRALLGAGEVASIVALALAPVCALPVSGVASRRDLFHATIRARASHPLPIARTSRAHIASTILSATTLSR
jgi:hypothetical protein